MTGSPGARVVHGSLWECLHHFKVLVTEHAGTAKRGVSADSLRKKTLRQHAAHLLTLPATADAPLNATDADHDATRLMDAPNQLRCDFPGLLVGSMAGTSSETPQFADDASSQREVVFST